MSLLELIAYVFVAFMGAAVVFTRRPMNQVLVYGVFGISLTLLFFVLHAPDVALSELAVGTVILPLAILVTIVKTVQRS